MGAVLTALTLTALTAPAAHADGVLIASDVATQAGIAKTTNDQYGNNVVFDYNGDGVSDLFLGNHVIAPADLYRGNPDGTYTLVQQFGVSDRHGCTAGRFNLDALPDLFCAIGAQHGTSNNKSNELWLQLLDGTFVLQPNALGANDSSGRGRDVEAVDVNGDGVDDIFVGNGFPANFPSPNKLYLSQPSGLFVQDTHIGKDHSGGVCLTHLDYDSDGDQDVFICGTPDHLYRNDGEGVMTDVALAAGFNKSKSEGVTTGDLNADGHPDLVLINDTSVTTWLGHGTTFTLAYTRGLVAGRNVALADVDGNGYPDLYVVQGHTAQVASSPNQPDYLMMNAGTGTAFTDMLIPQATSGAGSNVGVIPNYNGHPAFVVTNGGDGTIKFKGPRQLIAFTLV